MTQTPTNSYLRTKVMTASPEQLRLMLYDGAIRFCRQAVHALTRRDFDTSYAAIVRAQKIVLELSTSLNHEADTDLCGKLAALYEYIYRLLIDANMQRETEPLDEAIGLLDYQRQTWLMLMGKLNKPADDAVAATAAQPSHAAAHAGPLASIGPGRAPANASLGGFSAEG